MSISAHPQKFRTIATKTKEKTMFLCYKNDCYKISIFGPFSVFGPKERNNLLFHWLEQIQLLHFFLTKKMLKCWKNLKRWFQPANSMASTRSLVKIHNNTLELLYIEGWVYLATQCFLNGPRSLKKDFM